MNNQTKPKQGPRPNARSKGTERLNLKNPPRTIFGVPEQLFVDHHVDLRISGVNDVRAILYEKTATGERGREIPYEEVLRLCRAPGFVRSQAKEETRTELTEKTRATFYNAGLDAKAVKDPKAFVKITEERQNHLLEAKKALARAGTSEMDRQCKLFYSELLNRAYTAEQRMATLRSTGETFDESKILSEEGLPQSMKSVFLTDHLKLAQQASFSSSFLGKDLTRFCNLTVREIRDFTPENLEIFYPGPLAGRLRKACADKALAAYLGSTDWGGLTDKAKNRILQFGFPIVPIISRVDILKRYEAHRTQARIRAVVSAQWKPLTIEVNRILGEHYLCAPTNVPEVKDFWNGVAGTTLVDPMLSSSNYRVQTIEVLERDRDNYPARELPEAIAENPVISIAQKPIENLLVFVQESTTADGNRVVRTAREIQDFANYQPIEIVGVPKKVKKKDRERALATKKSNLSKRSAKLYHALRQRGIAKDVLTAVKQYLESFLTKKIQEIAAHIVYVTCELKGSTARTLVLHEVADPLAGGYDEDEDDPGEGDDENEEEEEEDADDDPPPVITSQAAEEEIKAAD